MTEQHLIQQKASNDVGDSIPAAVHMVELYTLLLYAHHTLAALTWTVAGTPGSFMSGGPIACDMICSNCLPLHLYAANLFVHMVAPGAAAAVGPYLSYVG